MTTTPDKGQKVDLGQVLSGLSKIKLRGGVVGRICWVLIITVVSIAAIAIVAGASPTGVIIGSISIISIVVLVYRFLNRIIDFADKHPEHALMEGAEIIKFEEIRFGTKANPMLPPATTESRAAKEVLVDAETAALPDVVVADPKRLTNG